MKGRKHADPTQRTQDNARTVQLAAQSGGWYVERRTTANTGSIYLYFVHDSRKPVVVRFSNHRQKNFFAKSKGYKPILIYDDTALEKVLEIAQFFGRELACKKRKVK